MNITRLLVLTTGTLLLATLVFFSPLRFLDNLFYDLNFAFAPRPAGDEVVVVGQDVKSIGELGSLPWPRTTTARLIDAISACGPKAVALDILFPRSADSAASDSLALAFSRVPNLVLPFRAGEVTSVRPATPPAVPPEVFSHRFMIVKNAQQLGAASFYQVAQFARLDSTLSRFGRHGGFLNVSTSSTTQKIREVVHVMQAGEEYYPSFALAAVAASENLAPAELALDGAGPSVSAGSHQVRLSSYAGSAFVNFRSDAAPLKVIPAVDLLTGRSDRSALAGKLVFVGVTDPAAGSDFFTTPVRSQFPGVVYWATAAMDIIEGTQVRWGGGWLAWGNWLLVLLLFPGLALLIPADRRIVAMAAGLVLLAGSVALSAWLFGSQCYFWNPGGHLYAWVFSLLWLAAEKASPVLAAGETPLKLEPGDEEESEVKAPPQQTEYLQSVPQTETAIHVAATLQPAQPAAAELGVPGQTQAAMLEKLRALSGGVIVGTLGSGGMADVYLIWNPRMEVYRAVKVIKPGRNPTLLERFETEIRIIAKLEHPNIVRCYGVSDWHKLPVVEMEYVNGASYEGILRKHGSLTPIQALVSGVLTCRALHYAHRQTITIYGKAYKGVIHRDIKPANIMLTRGGRLKLADFGIARPTEVSIHTLDSGNVVGTLPYLAPEQLDADAELTARTDVYALGATLYEMLTGKRAFPQRDVTSLVKAKSLGTIVEPLQPSATLPKALVDAIAKAMATDPAQRYESAGEFGRDLEKCLRAMGVKDGYSHLRQLCDAYWGGAKPA